MSQLRWICLCFILLWAITLAFAQETQTFVSADGAFSFEYPMGWSTELDPTSNPPNQITLSNGTGAEDFSIGISAPIKFYAFSPMKANTPKEMVEQYIVFIAELVHSTPSSEPQITEFVMNNRTSVYGYASIEAKGVENSFLVVVIDLGDDYWATMATESSLGDLQTVRQREADVLQIAQSLRYIPPRVAEDSRNPDLPWIYSSVIGLFQRGSIKFSYPDEWFVSIGIPLKISNIEIPPLSRLIRPIAGQFVAEINGVSETRITVDASELDNECNIPSTPWTARTMAAYIVNDRLSTHLEEMTREQASLTQPEIVTVNGVEIAYFREILPGYESLIMLVDLGDSNVPMIRAVAVRGEMAAFEDQLFQVASTMRYTPIIPEHCTQP